MPPIIKNHGYDKYGRPVTVEEYFRLKRREESRGLQVSRGKNLIVVSVVLDVTNYLV